MGRVFTLASAKGGVGKTTTTANLGAALAAAGYETAVVDGDLGMPNLGGALGVEPDGPTLHDVLVGEATVEEATYEGPEGVAVVPGAVDLDRFADVDPTDLESAVESLESYEYVLVDAGAGLSHDSLVPLTLADEVFLVSTVERDALRDTEKTRQVTERLGGCVAGAVLTRVPPGADTGVATARLEPEVVRTVPEDETVRTASADGTPLSSYAPRSPAATAYRALAGMLVGDPLPEPNADGGPEGAANAPDADGRVTDNERPADDVESDDAALGSAVVGSKAGEEGDGTERRASSDAAGATALEAADAPSGGVTEAATPSPDRPTAPDEGTADGTDGGEDDAGRVGSDAVEGNRTSGDDTEEPSDGDGERSGAERAESDANEDSGGASSEAVPSILSAEETLVSGAEAPPSDDSGEAPVDDAEEASADDTGEATDEDPQATADADVYETSLVTEAEADSDEAAADADDEGEPEEKGFFRRLLG